MSRALPAPDGADHPTPAPPLHGRGSRLLVDSTGIEAEGNGEWPARKRTPSRPRQRRKVHLGIDAETLEVRAVEFTGSHVGDAPMLPDLLDQSPVDSPSAW